MNERVALITGGARGIGRAIGLDLAAAGWSVAFCYRKSAEDAATAASAIEAQGARAMAVQADVSDPEICRGLVKQVETDWGRIDALINCAGPYHRVDLMKESDDGWREMFANNLDPVYYLGQAVAPGMIERRWGRIVSFGMANADQLAAQPTITGHFISKVGVLILTRTFARMLAPHGITVNAISPGFIDSGSAESVEMEQMVKRIPAGYVGTLDDAVNTVRFLLSDEARYVNGANLHLSGAWGL